MSIAYDQEQEIARLRQLLEQKDAIIQRQQKLLQKTRDIMRNPDVSPAFKVLNWSHLDLYPDAVLSGGEVQPDVKAVYKNVGVSAMSATNFYNASKETGNLEYGYERGHNEESGQHYTESLVKFPSTFGTAPLNASKTVRKNKEAEQKRREEKTRQIEATRCQGCGQPHSHVIVGGYCESCEKISHTQKVELSKVRIVEQDGASPLEPRVTEAQPDEPVHETPNESPPLMTLPDNDDDVPLPDAPLPSEWTDTGPEDMAAMPALAYPHNVYADFNARGERMKRVSCLRNHNRVQYLPYLNEGRWEECCTQCYPALRATNGLQCFHDD